MASRHVVVRCVSSLFALWLLASVATAHAQAPILTPTRAELELGVRRARPVQLLAATLAGLGTAVVTAGLTGGAIAVCNEKEGGPCSFASVLLIPSSGLLLLPAASAATTQWIGRKHHVEGSYGRAWAFGLLGTFVGAGAGVGVALALPERAQPMGFALGVVGLASVGASIGAVRGYNQGARSRLATLGKHLSPSLSATDDKRGAMLSARGRF